MIALLVAKELGLKPIAADTRIPLRDIDYQGKHVGKLPKPIYENCNKASPTKLDKGA